MKFKNLFPGARREAVSGRPVPRLNWVVFVCMLLLLAVGVVFIRSATAIRTDRTQFLYLDMIRKWIPAGLVLHFLVARVDYRKWCDWAWAPYLVTLVALVLVMIPGVGTERLGAQRWLFGFQPSEFAKFSVMPMMAFLLTGTNLRNNFGKLLIVLGAAAVPAALIMMQPDLGTALSLVPTALAMAFVAGCAPRSLLAMVLAGLILVGVFFMAAVLPEKLPPEPRERVESVVDRVMFPHWKKRILVFVYPDRDPLGAGWNKRQSEIAVGSGGRWGKGYLKGRQNILGYLPRAVSSTDFIYSVIAEETGFAGSVVLLGLYIGLLGGIVTTGLLCRDPAGRLICTGVSALLFTHIFINVAMTIGKMPITGIPLPLVSYGGSFTLSTMALLGLVQSVAIHGGGSGKGRHSP
ncbi:MAG: FtsW/RodA/SpoVE family cell cycle protein [Kiritimatiellia bacterium]|jgi:rod shape determining protein RodA